MESLMGYFYNDAGSIFDYLVDGVIILSEPQQIKQVSEDLKNERNTRYFDLLDQGRLLPSFYHNFLDYQELYQGFCRHRLFLLCQLSPQTGDILSLIHI